MCNKIISPSSLNVFIRDPAVWVLRTFLKIYGNSNMYAVRGILVEHAVNMRLKNSGKLSLEEFKPSALKKIEDTPLTVTDKDLEGYYKWGMKCYKELPVIYITSDGQDRVSGNLNGVEMAGYTDYKCSIKPSIEKGETVEYYIDLKTVSKPVLLCSRGKRKGLVKSDKRENVRQQVIYRALTGKPQQLYFIDETGHCLRYKIGYRDYKEHLPLILESLEKIKYLLTLTLEDVILDVELDQKKMNNLYSFDWSEELRNKARELWKI